MICLKKSHLAALITTLSTLTLGSTLSADDASVATPVTTTAPATTSTTTSVTTSSTTPAPTATAATADSTAAKAAPTGFTHEEILKLSQAFGHFIGRNLNNPGIEFDLDSIIRGMRSGVAGEPAPMSDQDYEKMMAKLQENAYRQLSEENLKAAKAFLEKNKTAEGIIEIEPNKLQYSVLHAGNGAAVQTGGTPQIKYVGKYLDGTTFGNSEEAGGPITVPLNQTIQGFSRGLVGMKEGEKRRLFVHPDLGYGTMGQLPPNALLIFDVEVVKADTPNYKPNSLSQMMQGGAMDEDEGDDEDDDDDYDDEDDEDDDAAPEHKDPKGAPAVHSTPNRSMTTSGSTQPASASQRHDQPGMQRNDQSGQSPAYRQQQSAGYNQDQSSGNYRQQQQQQPASYRQQQQPNAGSSQQQSSGYRQPQQQYSRAATNNNR